MAVCVYFLLYRSECSEHRTEEKNGVLEINIKIGYFIASQLFCYLHKFFPWKFVLVKKGEIEVEHILSIELWIHNFSRNIQLIYVQLPPGGMWTHTHRRVIELLPFSPLNMQNWNRDQKWHKWKIMVAFKLELWIESHRVSNPTIPVMLQFPNENRFQFDPNKLANSIAQLRFITVVRLHEKSTKL